MKKVKRNLESLVREILKRLEREYPDTKCHLEFRNSFELLISTVLAAQCTDVTVNKVMTPLYKKKYKTAKDILNDGLEKFKEKIKSITFYNNKSKAILELSKSLVEEYDGKVPDSMEQLTKLKGVGRKSANVILGNWFGKKDVIIVDTHLKRVSTRLGLVENDNADKIEFELKEIVPNEEQYNFSMRVGEHGRVVCKAKKPLCEECLLSDICPSVIK